MKLVGDVCGWVRVIIIEVGRRISFLWIREEFQVKLVEA